MICKKIAFALGENRTVLGNGSSWCRARKANPHRRVFLDVRFTSLPLIIGRSQSIWTPTLIECSGESISNFMAGYLKVTRVAIILYPEGRGKGKTA